MPSREHTSLPDDPLGAFCVENHAALPRVGARPTGWVDLRS